MWANFSCGDKPQSDQRQSLVHDNLLEGEVLEGRGLCNGGGEMDRVKWINVHFFSLPKPQMLI